MERRDAGIVILVIATVSLMAAANISEPTGMLAGNDTVRIGIANITRGEIWQLNYSTVIKQYTPTMISCIFKNVGSTTVLERMELHIETLQRNVTTSFYDGFFTLIPGDSKKFTVNYTHVNDTGYFLLHLNASYAGKVAQSWGIFLVLPYYEVVIPPETGVPGAGAAGAPTDFNRTYEPGASRLSLNYQSVISLHPGQNYILPIIIENRGTASAYDVKVYASGTGVIFDVSPMYIAKIARGSSGVVLLSISVPFNAEPGTYTIDFSIAAADGVRTGRVDVNVAGGGTDKEQIESMIANYNYIYTTVKQRLTNIALDGKNVTGAFMEAEAGYSDIQSAMRSYDSGDYEGARKALDSAKKHLEDALIMGEYVTIPQITLYLPGNITMLIIVVIALVVATSYHFISSRRRVAIMRIEKERIKSGG